MISWGHVLRPYLGAIYQRAGTITRSHQQKLKAWQESTGREVTKVIKTHDKTSVIFVCMCLFEFELQIKNSKNVVFKQFEFEFLRSGGKNLRDTAAYPRDFGDHIGSLHMGHMVPRLNIL